MDKVAWLTASNSPWSDPAWRVRGVSDWLARVQRPARIEANVEVRLGYFAARGAGHSSLPAATLEVPRRFAVTRVETNNAARAGCEIGAKSWGVRPYLLTGTAHEDEDDLQRIADSIPKCKKRKKPAAPGAHLRFRSTLPQGPVADSGSLRHSKDALPA